MTAVSYSRGCVNFPLCMLNITALRGIVPLASPSHFPTLQPNPTKFSPSPAASVQIILGSLTILLFARSTILPLIRGLFAKSPRTRRCSDPTTEPAERPHLGH
ncbi:hypothetical protein DE146DRAFT_208792 [Phaeosphaeria sp. MPI-PUGE-AT-0046c]|nr:hypothetical protein DE146DRAFT_208792 [Phaeosphaeria sp. MPI-PUGE-AT-0046c]